MPAPSQPEMRKFGDHAAVRDGIYANSLQAVSSLPPIENTRYRIELANPTFSGPGTVSQADHKAALLQGRTLARRLTADVRLIDKPTGAVADARRMTVASVPVLTNQGSFVLDGNSTILAHQARLNPGAYVRRKGSGEVSTHFAFLPGQGVPHQVVLDSETGVFRHHIGQAEIPSIVMLRALGATDAALDAAWGKSLADANRKAERPHHLDKFWERLGTTGPAPDDAAKQLAARVSKYPMDPWITQRTLGTPHQTYGKEPLLAATRKMLDVFNGRAEPDDRDSPTFSSVWGPEHLIPERIARAGPYLSKLLWQATNIGSLKRVQPGFLSPAIRSVFTSSGLGQSAEGVAAAEYVDHGARLTKVGEGGIGRSAESAPMSARHVSPGQFPWIDSVRTSESENVGLDLRTAFGVRLGADRQLYAPVVDVRTNKIVYKSPRDVADKNLAFPGAFHSDDPMVPAVSKGKLTHVPRHEVDYLVPSMEQSFSPLTNMVPLKSAMKPHRASMGSRMITQALPIVGAEAPYVRSEVPGQPGRSFDELFGRHMGAVFARHDAPGQVVAMTPNDVTVKYADGKTESYDLYDNHPSGRKTGVHNEAMVRVGDPVAPGQLLAKSNYTDNKGHAAYGLNLRTAWMLDPNAYEDSMVLSRSAADRLRSDHLYTHYVQNEPDVIFGKQAHVSAFPGRHSLNVLKSIDDDGVVKKGTVVGFGDPLIMAVRRKAGAYGRLSRSGKTNLSDASETWEAHEPGVVTDIMRTPHGPTVVVKTSKVAQNGDKACYDAATEVLTAAGWKPIADVTPRDLVASLTPAGELEYLAPIAVHHYPHTGPMYRLETTQVSLCVTAEHELYARRRDAATYALISAETLFSKRYFLKSNAQWRGSDPDTIVIPGSGYTRPCGQGGAGEQRVDPLVMEPELYLMLLGQFLSDGSCFYDVKSGSYGLRVSQIKEPNRVQLRCAWTAAGLTFSEQETAFTLYSRGLAEHLRTIGKTPHKHIPAFVFDYSPRLLGVLYRWLMWGNGSGSTGPVFHTGSRQLADDFQRLCLHLGMAGKVEVAPADEKPNYVKGIAVKTKSDSFRVSIYRHKLAPGINHGHATTQNDQREQWEDYTGSVYCVTLPRNHVLYVRRNGKPIWCGNSGRYGNKGVIVIKPDHEMPLDAQGRPLEAILSSLSVVSRVNPAQIFEAHLGKIAEKTGRPYVIGDFAPNQSLGDFVRAEAEKHGVPFQEDLTDPKTGRKIPGVGVGSAYIMKLHHIAASKAKGRGLGGYDESGQPLRGQSGAAMRASLGDTHALLSYGATKTIHDIHNYLGQDNSEFWAAFMAGYPPAKPTVSQPFQRFLTELRAAGINPIRENGRYHLTGLNDADVREMAGDREVLNGETLDLSRDGKPIEGGLHDPNIFGTSDSQNVWGKITLHEPVVSPIYEEPTRRLLGLTEKQFRDTIAGNHSLPNGQTGMGALVHALQNYDVTKELAKAREQHASSRKTARDEAARKLGYLKALDAAKKTPADWTISALPVMPPGYRPVSPGRGGKAAVVSDVNLLYKDAIDANGALRDLSSVAGNVGTERLNLYDAVKAVQGIGDPIGAKNRERGVRGVLDRLLGETSKGSFAQQKLLGTPINLSGRGQVLPNADFDMDQIGIPHSVAWEIYHPFVVRRLVRNGMGRVEAVKQTTDKSRAALQALQDEMESRPIRATRYPVLHRYGTIGFRPVLVAGDAIQTNHLVNKALGLDHDGDQQFNSVVIGLDESVRDAIVMEDPPFWSFRDMTARFRTSVPLAHDDRTNYYCVRLEDFPHTQLIGTKGHIDFYAVPPGIRVVAYDEANHRPVLAEVSGWSIHRDREVEIVNLQSGRQIVSDDDPRAVYGIDSESLEFVRRCPTEAKGLMVPRVDRFDEAASGLANLVVTLQPGRVRNVSLTPDFGYVCGLLVGNGWTSGPDGRAVQLHLACTDPGVVAAYRAALPALTDNEHLREKTVRTEASASGYGASSRLTLSDTVAAELIAVTLGRGAHNKHLPPFYLSGDSAFRKRMLEGLLDTDGSVALGHGKIKPQLLVNYSSVSLRLVQEIQHLCRSLGIGSSISATHTPRGDAFWLLNISGPDVQGFGLQLHHTQKSEKLARAPLASKSLGGYLRNHMLPIPQGIARWFREELLRKIGRKAATAHYARISDSVRSGRIARPFARELIAAYPMEIPTELWNRFVAIVADDSTVWDEVVSYQRTGLRETGYDLTVPGFETFMSTDGLILSNTMTVSVPLSEDAKKEVYEKLLPSKNLFAPSTFKATTFLPNMEDVARLHYATSADDGNAPVEFQTLADARRALQEGHIKLSTRVRILDNPPT